MIFKGYLGSKKYSLTYEKNKRKKKKKKERAHKKCSKKKSEFS